MSDNDAKTVGTLATVSVPASERNPIAKVTVAFMKDKPEFETLVQLTNPIGQVCTLYVMPSEKKRVIASMRAALDAWEKAP